MIYDFLNKRNSLRNLSNEEFEDKIDRLAEELLTVEYKVKYSDDELKKDWQQLKKFATTEESTNSTNRVGLKLCEHFFPNFYNIKNSKGQSFSSCWNKEVLMKVLRWNRKSHSTPYLSEIKRGIYFCCGLTKNTMFRPHLAKTIVSSFDGNVVLDPCAGWGGRMLGTLAAGKKYIAFEPNEETFENLQKMANFLGEQPVLYKTGSENIEKNISENIDIVLTSPPYFNLEIYSSSPEQSENMYKTYEDWCDEWLESVIDQSINTLSPTGVSCWNVHDIGKMKMIQDVKNIHIKRGLNPVKTFSIVSSKRQSNQSEANKKKSDITICYKR